MNEQTLMNTALAMVKKGRGILAADESTPTIGKRFDQIGVDSTFETRNEYRGMLFTADGMENYISTEIYLPKMISLKKYIVNLNQIVVFGIYSDEC